jgi:thymidylate kinase
MEDINTRFFYYLSSVIGVQPQLKSMLSSGKKVVIDRYIHSTIAMHTVLGAQVGSVAMRELPIVWPNVGILLTAETDVRIRRIESRAKHPTHDKRIERFVKEAEEAEVIYRSFNDLSPIDTTHLSIDQVFAVVSQLLRSQ